MSIWKEVPGRAKDISVDASGAAWVIGTNPVPGGFSVYRWNEARQDWDGTRGAGVRISCGGATPYVVDGSERILRGNPAMDTWEPLPGGAAKDVGPDTSVVCVIGVDRAPGGFGIYEADSSQVVWRRIPGGGVAISGGLAALIVNDADELYARRGPSSFDRLPGAGKDVAVQGSNRWLIGTNPIPGGFGIWSWASSVNTWVPVDGGGVRIGCGGPHGAPWVVNDEGKIYRRLGYEVNLKAYPQKPPMRTPVTVTIECRDANFGVALDVPIYINRTKVGTTNKPFSYTFRSVNGDPPIGYVKVGEVQFMIDFGFETLAVK